MADYQKQIYRQLAEALEKIDDLLYVKIPQIKNKYEQKLYDTTADAADRLAALRREKDSTIAALNTQIAKLKEELHDAENEISRLRSLLNMDSSNSSLPPSRDIPSKGNKTTKSPNEYNSRVPSGKTRGGQPGHKGKTLTSQDIEDLINEHGDDISHVVIEIGKTDASAQEKPVVKYELDLNLKVVVREYHYYGNAQLPCRHYPDVSFGDFTRATAAYCYGECNMPTDKIGMLMNALSGGIFDASEGSWYNFCRYISDRTELSLEKLKQDLQTSPVLYSDATVTKENGKESYIRNVSNADTVIYSAQDKKTIEEISKTAVLKQFKGILVTDHETSMKHFGGKNAECNGHTDRYCKKNTQETNHKWSGELMTLMYEIKNEKETLQNSGIERFTQEQLTDYFNRYDRILEKGWEENKDLEWEYVAKEERALLRRLAKYKEDHLRFATDFCVEFTNNISETDLRFIKGRTKQSGGFREKSGREMCCRVMSIIRTCKKRGISVIGALAHISRTGENVFA